MDLTSAAHAAAAARCGYSLTEEWWGGSEGLAWGGGWELVGVGVYVQASC